MTDGPDVTLLGAAEIRALAGAARHPADQAVGAELRRRRQHGAAHRAGGRASAPATPSSRWAPGWARSPWPCCRSSTGWSPSRSTRCSPRRCPSTVAAHAPALADRLEVVPADALAVRDLPGPPPTALVANLPYNVSVPVVLRFLELFPSLRTILVMVQLEVAERLAAPPGSRTYGVPSVKAAWYADVRLAGSVLAQRLLAGAQRRLRPGDADPARAAGDRRPPARRSSRASTRPSPSAARRCGPRWPRWAGLAGARRGGARGRRRRPPHPW